LIDFCSQVSYAQEDILLLYIYRIFIKEIDMARHRQTKPVEGFDFTWWRREKGPGFRWEEDRGRWLLVGPPNDSLRPYEPLVEHTGLFLTFAHLDGNMDSFLGFANTYGRLGTYQAIGEDHGEPLDEWQEHHRWLRFLARVLSESMKRRPKLGKIVSWKDDEVIFRFPKIGTAASEEWRHRGELRKRLVNKQEQSLFKPGDSVGPARWFLCYAIDYWLGTLAKLDKPIAARMVWSEAAMRPQLLFGPTSLLGAMVGQIAAALHGAWPFKECAFCHRFFRLAPGVNRANRLTCSLTCKQYQHNEKVERASQLFNAGWTARQIAKELHVQPYRGKSSIDMVKTWIEKS
jgi:hypothetical protein